MSLKLLHLLKDIDISAKFTVGIVFSMALVFTLSLVIILNMQSAAFSQLLKSSNEIMETHFEKNTKNAVDLQSTKINNLLSFLASVTPETIADSQISALEIFANEASKDGDINYVAFFDTDQRLLTVSGDTKKEKIKQGLFVAKKVIEEDFEFGEVVIGYSFDALNKKLEEVKVKNIEELNILERSKKATLISLTTSMILALSISGILIVLSLLWMFKTMIVNRLKALENNMMDIAEGEGDLRRRIIVKGNDGIDRVGKNFNLFLTKIHDTVTKVNSATVHVGYASQTMTSITEESKLAIAAQQEETKKVVSAINEMAATVAEIAKNASEAASAAQQANDQSTEGQVIVNKSIEDINKLAGEVESAADVIENLKSDSQNIGGVLDVIQSIAEQTNLLALNAAIEAARAGEQGRGFAVVADEVRILAQRTHDATSEIKTMIDKLQSGANNASEVMNQSRDQAQKSVAIGNETGNSFKAITSEVSTISLMNTQIASAAEEQTAVVKEINNNIRKISEHGERTENAASQTTTASSELSNLSIELSELMNQFKVNEDTSAKLL